MSSIDFKLSQSPDGLIRKVSFPALPSWAELSVRIESLYHIPPQDLAVSYVDADGDEVTLSSEEELQDFYRTVQQPQDIVGRRASIRLAVRDLSALRAAGNVDKSLPETPLGTNPRNTFGHSIPLVFMEDDGWQRVPAGLGRLSDGMFNMPSDNDSEPPHAFVEVVESDVSARSQDRDSVSTISESDLYNVTPSSSVDGKEKPDKGKGKERARDDVSSTESVVSSQTHHKHPVHVMDMRSPGAEDPSAIRPAPTVSSPSRGEATPTPRPAAPTAGATASAPPANTTDDDPPLPELEDIPSPSPAPSLTNDVANLFSTLSTVFASHPELSEGVRNVVQNAANGTYWNTHRQTVARAAEEIRRSAEVGVNDAYRAAGDAQRAAEEAAGRRVAEAIANVVRVIGDITGNVGTAAANAGASLGSPPATSTPRGQRTAPGDAPHPAAPGDHPFPWAPLGPEYFSGFDRRRGPGRGRGGWPSYSFAEGDPAHGPYGRGSKWKHEPFVYFPPPPKPPPTDGQHPRGPPPPPPPPPGPPPLVPPPPPRMPVCDEGVSMRPPPPRPRGLWDEFHPPPVPPPPPFHHHHHHVPGAWPPMPPYPPFWSHRSGPPPPAPPPPHWATADMDVDMDPMDDIEHAEVTMFGAQPSPKQSTQAMKQSLQEAKERYRAEKERYRSERGERRRNRERQLNYSSDSAQQHTDDPESGKEGEAQPPGFGLMRSPTQIISNARGPYPQLELVNLPRRNNTMHGTGHRYAGLSPVSPLSNSRSRQAVTRRLGDMGFTAAVYPALPGKLRTHIPTDSELSKEEEDTVVSHLLDELLTLSPKPTHTAPSGSGSGAGAGAKKDHDLPGAFPSA